MSTLFRLSLLLMAGMSAVSAYAEMSNELFTAFARCDASFFRQLKITPLPGLSTENQNSAGDLAWIKVPNRKNEKNSRIDLPTNIRVGGLPVLQYQDQVSDLGSLGLYYTWGFVIGAPLEKTHSVLESLIERRDHLKKGLPEFVRVDVKIGNSDWLPVHTPINNAVGLRKTERVLLLEPYESDSTLATCSIQGLITPDILRELRPDIPSSEYPKPPAPPAGFDETPIPAKVRQIVVEFAHTHPEWQPRFKHIKLQVHWPTERGPASVANEIWATADNLIKVRELYSEGFQVERLFALAGLLQLKSKFYTKPVPTDRIFILNELSLTDALTHSGSINLKTSSGYLPESPGLQTVSSHEVCNTTGSRSARDLHPSLRGELRVLKCSDDQGQFTREVILIESLGLTLKTRQAQNAPKRITEYSYTITNIEY